MSNYFLMSDTEADRLRLQASVWEPAARAMLQEIGVQPDWSCLDVGCGVGGILGLLSRLVGPTGRVVGIDTEPSLLEEARSFLVEQGLTNIELYEKNLIAHDFPLESFELVHERLVLPFVDSTYLALENMIGLTKPGGVVALQEADQSSWNYWPEPPGWPRLREITEQALDLRGDSNVGRRAFSLLRQAGLEQVQARAHIRALQDAHPYMRLPLLTISGMESRILASGISTEGELGELLASVREAIRKPDTLHLTFTLVQAWGWKPQATTT